MMRKNKKLIAGVLLLVLLILLYLFLQNQNMQEEQEDTAEEDNTQEIVAMDTEEIASLSYELEGDTVTWIQTDGTWSLEGDEDFPVDEDQIQELLDQLVSVRADRILEDVDSLKEYGLETPYKVITVEKTDETSVRIAIGDQNDTTGDCYIYLNDDPGTVYTVTGSLRTAFSGELYDFVVGETYPDITSSTITNIQVEKSSDSYRLYTTEDSDTGWMVSDENNKEKEADSTEAETLQNAIAGLDFDHYYDYDCEDFSKYGLDDPGAVIQADYTVQQEVEDSDSEDENTDEEETETQAVDMVLNLYVGDQSEDGSYYVRIGDSSQVHGISAESLDEILDGSSMDYWKMSVSSMNISKLDVLEVTYQGETHQLKRTVQEVAAEDDEEETTTETTYYVDEQEVDSQTFTDFYSAAGAMTYQSREEEGTRQKAELELKYYDVEENQLLVTYTSWDENFYLAADSKGNYGLVNKMSVKNLIEELQILLEEAEK